MKEFDLIVVGSGAGMNVAARAIGHGMTAAVVDSGPLGGTCLNRGCIPSKVMLYPADVIRMAEEAKAIGVQAKIEKVDFELIMNRVWEIVLDGRHEMEHSVAQIDEVEFFNVDGTFVSDYTMKVGEEMITADKIFIASGARPLISPIEGIEEVGYLTSATIFDLKEPPKSLIIVGGGYIAAEFAHFFSAIGTEVIIVGRNVRLVPQEEPEVSELLKKRMSGYSRVYTNHEAIRAEIRNGQKVIVARNRSDGQLYEFTGQEILIAASRRSNADILQPEKTGVETDARGWIKVDPYLQTTKEGIWAFGDATGKHMFRHTANYESEVVWMNAFTEHKHPVDEHAVPHAVFTHPQIASAGMTEEQAKKTHDILVGMKKYSDTPKGYAMGEEDGFVKVVVENGTGKILGAHVIGPHAAILVQQLVYLMNTEEQNYLPLAMAQTIHPALSEVVVGAFGNLRPVGEHEHHHQHTH
ncbi:MAG: dihydrolipoyl dehydrogenase [Chloroflexota bacterium]|nr:dihydrolipoyl dehydrogenase [Chloroflexota bacterium]